MTVKMFRNLDKKQTKGKIRMMMDKFRNDLKENFTVIINLRGGG